MPLFRKDRARTGTGIALTPPYTDVTFDRDIGTTSYAVFLEAVDAQGAAIGVTAPTDNRLTSGFRIYCDEAGTGAYIARK